MTKKYQKTLQLDLGFSNRLLYFIVIIHILALIACVINALPSEIKMTLFFVVCINLFLVLNRYVFPGQPYSIRHDEGHGWEVASTGEYHRIRILSSTVVTPFLIILHYKEQTGTKKSILICNDAVSVENYRNLLITIKLDGINKESDDGVKE